MADQQTVLDIAAKARAAMAELDRLSEIAGNQRQAGDVAGLVETQDAIIRLDTELLSCAQQIGEMQYEALQRAEAERDAALAEVDRLRGLLPKWRVVSVDSYGHTDWELSGNHYGAVLQPKGEGIPIGKIRELERMRGFPECEVVE